MLPFPIFVLCKCVSSRHISLTPPVPWRSRPPSSLPRAFCLTSKTSESQDSGFETELEGVQLLWFFSSVNRSDETQREGLEPGVRTAGFHSQTSFVFAVTRQVPWGQRRSVGLRGLGRSQSQIALEPKEILSPLPSTSCLPSEIIQTETGRPSWKMPQTEIEMLKRLARMPFKSPLALVPWKAQRVFHPENQQRTLLGRRPYTSHSTGSRRCCLWADTPGSPHHHPGANVTGSELSTPSSASWSFRRRLTRLQRQKVEAEAFPKTDRHRC